MTQYVRTHLGSVSSKHSCCGPTVRTLLSMRPVIVARRSPMLFPGPSWCMSQPTHGFSRPIGVSWQAITLKPPRLSVPGSAIVPESPACISALYPFGMSLGFVLTLHGHFLHCFRGSGFMRPCRSSGLSDPVDPADPPRYSAWRCKG